jgi:hypothetical protein
LAHALAGETEVESDGVHGFAFGDAADDQDIAVKRGVGQAVTIVPSRSTDITGGTKGALR